MELANAIDVLNHTFLAIVSGILAFDMDYSYLLTYFVGALFLLLCLVYIVVF